MKHLISRRNFLKAAGVTTAAAAMAVGAPAASACWTGEKSEVTILYTNDVHTYIDKQAPKLTYAAIAALKQSYQNAGKKVLLVDAGDHVQGTAYGSMDQGASIIELMNAAGYDAATPGNHEFDYGMDRAKELMRDADFPYLSCNWVDLRTNLRVLPEIKVFVRGGVRIAFVGITTPETFTKSTPAYFMNKAQTKYIYDILGGEDGQKLYSAVQKAVDKAKCLADVVIGLGHLGVDPSSSPWTSEEVIAHTTGFDAFIDGHSHTVMENKQVADASGRLVTLTQTGSYFANVGEMTIAPDGTISTRLVSTYDQEDPAVAAEQAAWVSSVDEMLGEKIAVADTKFYITDPATGKRRIRSGETNLGDFVADGIYTYFNEVEQLHCDIAMLDKMYDLNMAYFKELSMYILAGKKKLANVRANELQQAMDKAKVSGLPEDAQAARDLADQCERFEKKLYDLELTRNISLQMGPQIRLLQNNDTMMAEKIQSTIVNTIPLWKNQMVLALGLAHSQQAMQAERAVTDMTNDLLKKNAEALKMGTIETAKESQRGVVDIETLQQTNKSLIETLDELNKIQSEGRAKRAAAEQELNRIEDELKAKMMEIRS